MHKAPKVSLVQAKNGKKTILKKSHGKRPQVYEVAGACFQSKKTPKLSSNQPGI